MPQIGGAVGLAALVAISPSVEDGRLPEATAVSAQARAAGNDHAIARALAAVIHGSAAAYTASLGLLAARFVTLLGATRRPAKPPPEDRSAGSAPVR